MPMINIDEIGSVGLIVDVPSYALHPLAWTSVGNVKFVDGKATKAAGQEVIFGTPLTSPHYMQAWAVNNDSRWVYAGETGIYYNVDVTHTDITRYTTTPGDDDYTAGTRPVWTGGNLHGIPILNHDNETDAPQQWDESLGRMKDLDNWPASTYCKVMRPFQNFLVALNVTKGSVNYPYMVKWSHPADPGTVPTSWDETDATKLTGEQTISQSGGFLVDCLPLAGQNIIYKEDSIWAMRLAGSQFVFSFIELSSSTGLLAPDCVKEFYGQHFVVGQTDIVLFDGSRIRSISTKKVRDWFYAALHPNHWDKTKVSINYGLQEATIAFVGVGATSGYLTKALIWNWDTDTWTLKELPDVSFIEFGRVVTAAEEAFDDASGTFDSDFGYFNSSANTSPVDLRTIMAKAYSSSEFLLADSTYADRGTPYTSLLERTGLPVAGQSLDGSLVIDAASVKFVRALFPKISAPSSMTLQISIGMQDTLNGPVTWDGPHDFIVGTDVKVDVAISGKFLCLRFEDTEEVPWVFSGYAVDLDVISEF